MGIASTATTVGLAIGQVETWAGTIQLKASAVGVQQVQLPDWRAAIPATAANQTRLVIESHNHSREAEHWLRQALEEVADYFGGTRRVFSVPLDLQGPPFFRRVWAEVGGVPYGETRSYVEVARLLGRPQAARAVGAANGANPVAPFVPCQRIVGSDGNLTGYGPGLPLKQRLLAMEDAIPGDPADYPAWVKRVAWRLGTSTWVLGLRHTKMYCAPMAAPASMRTVPNRLFVTEAEAEVAGYRKATHMT